MTRASSQSSSVVASSTACSETQPLATEATVSPSGRGANKFRSPVRGAMIYARLPGAIPRFRPIGLVRADSPRLTQLSHCRDEYRERWQYDVIERHCRRLSQIFGFGRYQERACHGAADSFLRQIKPHGSCLRTHVQRDQYRVAFARVLAQECQDLWIVPIQIDVISVQQRRLGVAEGE